MNIYLFPTDMEAAPFLELQPSARVVVSGVGMAATAATLAELYRKGTLDGVRVVLAGLAGTYGDGVAVGDVVEVTQECCAELPERFRRSYKVAKSTGLCAVRANSVHRGVAESCGAEVENMEGAALFAMAEALGFEVVEVRAISNRVGEPYAMWRVEEALRALALALKNIEENG